MACLGTVFTDTPTWASKTQDFTTLVYQAAMKISPTKNRHGTSEVVFYLLLNLELIRILNENHYIIREWPYYQMLLNSEIGITELKNRPKERRLMNSKV